MALNTTAATWVAGTVVTAAQLNLEIRDAINGIQAAWTAYTPTWTASPSPAIGNGTLTGKWIRVGKTIYYRINLTMGSTTTYGTGNWALGLPTAAHADYTANMHMGNGMALDTSATAFGLLTVGYLSSTTVYALATASTVAQSTVPWTWAVGDKFSIDGTYEAA